MGMTPSEIDKLSNSFESLIKEQRKTNKLLKEQNKFKHTIVQMFETKYAGTQWVCSCGHIMGEEECRIHMSKYNPDMMVK